MLLVLALLTAGCAGQRPWVDRALMAEPTPTAALNTTAAEYQVSCPDLLEIKVSGRPELNGTQEIEGDGRIKAANGERVRVEGLSTAEVARRLTAAARLRPDQVTVRVAEYRSQHIYLIGQVVGLQRTVAYQGPERVLDLLQRVGGVTSGAAPDEVYVVRSRIAEGKQPEVYRVRMREILTKQDQSTNILLQPQDQIYVGETNRSALSRYLPPWLKPLFDSLWGMARPDKPAQAAS
ncbi:MAG TPA: polysaccharide biosynthesis/export family protein [Gemmataceae bacterium]|jgi:protein involved in polysaccharide export with SLBB domain|nr:polysaccharide biosynthesis/export family protein [Gemmataceae bacterium]